MIMQIGTLRKIDELGRIVLPVEVRKKLSIEVKDTLEIIADTENGQIILRKTENKCLRCQSAEDLKEIKTGSYLCKRCIDELN